jgi:hypothetical protein
MSRKSINHTPFGYGIEGLAMGIRRITPDVDSYLDEDEDITPASAAPEEDLFEEEDENEVAARSSVVQVGWAAAKKAVKAASKAFATDFRFEEDVQLIKFLSAEPMSFSQHWVQRQGKKSFICLGDSSCPLCRAGNKPEQKFAFSVVNLSSDDDPTVSMMTVGLRLCGQLEKLDSDPKTGPLDRLYWAVSKSGQGQKTSYSIQAVKDRDLAEDWDLDPQDVVAALKSLKPLGPDAFRMSTVAELSEIAREIPED